MGSGVPWEIFLAVAVVGLCLVGSGMCCGVVRRACYPAAGSCAPKLSLCVALSVLPYNKDILMALRRSNPQWSG